MIRVFFAELAVTIVADVFDSIPVTNEILNSTFFINESFLFLSFSHTSFAFSIFEEEKTEIN